MDDIGEHPEMGVGEWIFDRRCEVVGEEDGGIELDDPSIGGLPSVERLSLGWMIARSFLMMELGEKGLGAVFACAC